MDSSENIFFKGQMESKISEANSQAKFSFRFVIS